MVVVGKDYGSSIDAGVPRVTHEMAVHAVRIIMGAAHDADDARFLVGALGFPKEFLREAKRAVN